MMSKPMFSFVCGMLLTCMVVGCNSQTVTEEVSESTALVTGTVEWKGKPVSSGSLVFYPLQGGDAPNVSLGSQGEFQLTEPVPPGTYLIYIVGNQQLPEKYQAETSSDYQITLNPGQNDISIRLK